MEEKDKVELISTEDVEKVVATLGEAQNKFTEVEDSNIDLNKVKELVSNFEGVTVHTAVATLATSFLLLPAGAIMAVMDMGKKAFTAKALAEVMKMMGKEGAEENKED